MRTKALLLGAMIGAASLATSMAQVYSVNIVGYINVPIPSGFSIVANQLNNSAGNAIENIIPNSPTDISVYKWVAGNWVIVNWDHLGQYWDDTTTLNPGEGFWVYNAGAPWTLTLVGEVQTGTSTVNLGNGLNLVAPVVPQEGFLQANLGYTPSAATSGGDTVYCYRSDTIGWGIYNWDCAGQYWDEEPTIHVGEGFWVWRQASAAWTRTFNVGP